MEEKASFNSDDEGDFDFIPAGMLDLDNEGLLNEEGEVGYISDDGTESHNRFDENAMLNHNQIHDKHNPLSKQVSNRTVSSISSAGGGPNTIKPGLDKRISERSNYSTSNASIELAVSHSHSMSHDMNDENNSHGVTPTPSERGSWNGRHLEKELSTRSNLTSLSNNASNNGTSSNPSSMRSPRSKRRGMFGSRKETNCSTHAEEAAAMEELIVLVGEEHLHKLEVRKNKQGFVVGLELRDAELDGPAPDCIGLFSQLNVLILEGCCIAGTFPLWLDSLYLLQELSLANNQIGGFIPDSIANLQSLQYLDLSGNQLSGSIPDSIGEIKTLTKLYLHQNDLSGNIPDSVCGLSHLTELNASNCCLTGHLPYHIGRLRALNTLLLFNNQLVGALPESLGECCALTEINLCNNHFKGHLPESLGKLSQLSSLNLFHNEFNGSIPSSIGNLHSLRFLSLASNHFRGPFPESVCNITVLEQLNLSKNILSGQIPGSVERMPMLTSLNLAYNRFKGSIPDSICRLLRLTELHLDHNSLTGNIPENIGSLLELTVLTLTHNQLSGQIPVSIGSLTALTTVHLSSNQLTGVIPESLGGLVSLQTIHLSHNQLTGSIPESIVNLVALCELDLSFNRLSGPIPEGIVNLQSLTEINLVDTYLSGYDTKKGIFLMSSCGIWAADQYGNKGISIVNFADWSPFYYRNAPLIARDHRKFQIPLSLISLFPHTLFLFPYEYLQKIYLDSSFYSHIRKAIFVFLKQVCEAQNPCILQCLVILWYLLMNSSKVHVSEEADLIEFAEEVVRITNELFKCPSMDKLKNVQRLILEPQYCQPIQKNLDGTFDSVTYWNMAHIFVGDSPIQFCLEHNFKFVLALTQITNITDQLFWGCVDTVPNNGKSEPCTPYEFSNTEFHSLTTYKVFACPRYTPAVMFFIEGVSKLYTLILVSFVCNYTYGEQKKREYSGSLAENLLVVILLAQVLYEFGQLATCGWSLKEYFGGLWNILDVMSCTLLLFWLVLLPFPQYFYLGLGSIALSAIPLALLQLQYLSLIKTLGLLVLMIQSMMVDVLTFIIVYLVSIYGFTVSFRAMFYTVDSYGSTGITFITLFQSTLGNFFFSDFDDTFATVGQLLMVVFLVLTNVLLVNLLIAQMSSTYNRIVFKSREEWTFVKASYVQDNLLLSEKNPFCMLPPPLNLVTIGLYPLHVWALKNLNISVAGTAADYILGFYLFVPRFIFFWWKAVEATFIDLEDDDDDYQERYQTLMKILVLIFGKKITRLLVLLSGLPFGLVYSIVSTFVRVLYVVVRVKPLEDDEDGAYEINFYLDADDGECSDAGGDVHHVKDKAMVKTITPRNSNSNSPLTPTPYTFADALPDAFVPVPEGEDPHAGEAEAGDEDHDLDHLHHHDPSYRPPRPKFESKGAKRIKRAFNKKQSFIIDPDMYEEGALNSASPNQGTVRRTVNAKPNSGNKLVPKSSFVKNSTVAEDDGTNGMRKPSFSLFDIVNSVSGSGNSTANNASSSGGTSGVAGKKMSPKTSFNMNDGLLKRLSPNISFNLSDGSASGNSGFGKGSSVLSHKSSFNSNDGSSGKASRNNSAYNMHAIGTGSSAGSTRPLYSMNSMDYIPSSMMLGFEDDESEDGYSNTNNNTSNANAATTNTTTPHDANHTNNSSNNTMGLNLDIDTSIINLANPYTTTITTNPDTVSTNTNIDGGPNTSDSNTPYTPTTQAASNPLTANLHSIAIPPINTSTTDSGTDSAIGNIDTVYITDNITPTAGITTNPNTTTEHTADADTNTQPTSASTTNTVNPTDTTPTTTTKKGPSLTALTFANKMLTKVKHAIPHKDTANSGTTNSSANDNTHTIGAKDSALANEIANIGSDSSGSDYDSDGNKIVRKKIKDKKLFELFKRKASTNNKRQSTNLSNTHYTIPDSDSSGDELLHPTNTNTTVHSPNPPNTTNTGVIVPTNSRERAHSTASAVSNTDPNSTNNTNNTNNATGMTGLFGIVANAISPTTNTANTNSSNNNTTTHPKHHHHHHHLHKQDSNSSTNNNNTINNTLNSIGDTFNGTMSLLNGTKPTKPKRRPSLTHSDTDYSALNSNENSDYSESDSDSYRIEEGSDESHSESSYSNKDDNSTYSHSTYSEEPIDTTITIKKSHVLFTPEDILRMFPANESEQHKLEIQDEIRKLKTSTEDNVHTASAEMKNEFQHKMTLALQEIRMLREALGISGASSSASGIDMLNSVGMSGSGANTGTSGVSGSDKMKRLTSKMNSFGDKSSADVTAGAKSSKRTPSRHSSRAAMNTSNSNLNYSSSEGVITSMSSAVGTTTIAHNMALKGRKKSGISSRSGEGKSGKLSRPNSSSSMVSSASHHSTHSHTDHTTTNTSANANAKTTATTGNNTATSSHHSRSGRHSRSHSPTPDAQPSPQLLNFSPHSPESNNNSAGDNINSVFSPVIPPIPLPTRALPKWPPTPPAPAPPTPIVVPRRPPSPVTNNTTDTSNNTTTTAATNAAATEAELVQMKADMQSLQGDMSEIKKMLGALLNK